MVAPSRKKLLLIGRSGSGKSSMRSIIFSNYTAFDTHRLGATIDVEHSQLRFLGNVTLNLWDCGGQNSFIENYLTTQRDHIFNLVEVLIYVFDIGSQEVPKDMETFKRCLDNLQEFSPNAKVFVLLHKMDLVRVDRREQVFNATMMTLHAHANEFKFQLTGFATSIWDESLYKAWSAIVCSLMSNISALQSELETFAKVSSVQEVVLFEKTTFLLVAHATSDDIDSSSQADPKRFEKISNIIKSYRQSVSKLRTQLHSISLLSNNCVAVLEPLTSNTIIMTVLPKHSADTNMVISNIKASKTRFEELESKSNDLP